MEFHVKLAGRTVAVDTVREALLALDPTAVADVDAGGQLLRVFAEILPAELRALLAQVGCPVPADAVLEVPSFCCGSCSG